MKVRYNPVVGGLALVLGLVLLFLGAWLSLLGEFSPALIGGVMVTLLGVLHLVRPYFWVHPDSVVVSPLVGPRGRATTFQFLAVDRGTLFAVSADGGHTRVPVARWLAHSGDWRAVIEDSRVARA